MQRWGLDGEGGAGALWAPGLPGPQAWGVLARQTRVHGPGPPMLLPVGLSGPCTGGSPSPTCALGHGREAWQTGRWWKTQLFSVLPGHVGPLCQSRRSSVLPASCLRLCTEACGQTMGWALT